MFVAVMRVGVGPGVKMELKSSVRKDAMSVFGRRCRTNSDLRASIGDWRCSQFLDLTLSYFSTIEALQKRCVPEDLCRVVKDDPSGYIGFLVGV